MTLHESISSIVKKAIPEANQTSIENVAHEISLLVDGFLKEGAKQFSHEYLQRINRHCEPGSEMDRRLQGELGDMEQVLIANLSSMR